MYENADTRAQRLPTYNGTPVMAVETASEIVQAAQDYELASRDLQRFQTERSLIDENIKKAMGRMDEAAAHMIAIIQPTPKGRGFAQ